MKRTLIIILLLIVSLSHGYSYPAFYSKNMTSKSWQAQSAFDQYENQVIYLDSIVHSSYPQYKFSDCNISIEFLKSNLTSATIRSCNQTFNISKNKFTWLCNGYLIQYGYQFKNRISFTLGFILNTDWIHEGKYNCNNTNYAKNMTMRDIIPKKNADGLRNVCVSQASGGAVLGQVPRILCSPPKKNYSFVEVKR